MNISNQVGNIYVFEFAIKLGSYDKGCHNSSANVEIRTGASWQTSARGLLRVGTDVSTLYSNDIAISSIESNKWYKIKIKYSWISNLTIKLDYWLDGLHIAGITDEAFSYEKDLKYFTFNSANGITWFDDVIINEGETETEELPIVEIIAITTTAAAGVSLAVILTSTGLGKYKFYSFLALLGPLYLRTMREEVFDNEKRLDMYNFIADNQPVYYSQIRRGCNLSNGEISWHSHIMTELGLIRLERKGLNLFFKLSGKKLPDKEFVRLTDLQTSIYKLIKENPGITQKELVDKLKVKQQNISYNLLKLVEKNQIRIEKKGKTKFYYPIDL